MRGVGLDLLDIRRMKRPMENDYFVSRVFTQREQAYLSTRGTASAAGFFCAKEAVSKALGVGIFSIPLQAIEILHTETGQPFVVRHPPLIQEGQFFLSITHTKETAAAVAIWND